MPVMEQLLVGYYLELAGPAASLASFSANFAKLKPLEQQYYGIFTKAHEIS